MKVGTGRCGPLHGAPRGQASGSAALRVCVPLSAARLRSYEYREVFINLFKERKTEIMKKVLAIVLAVLMLTSLLTACGGSGSQNTEKSEVQKIIEQAQGMTLEELAKKAIEESNGKTFYGVGNSSRGKSALPAFIEYLQSIDPSYNMEFDWQQPKNNKIFDQLTAESQKAVGTYAMTLIQDGNQIENKMVKTGILDTFIPKEWAEAKKVDASSYKGYLALQTLNKVFMFNCTGSKVYNNCWQFVAEGAHGQFMSIDSEIVGKNFLYMLTKDEYATYLKNAFDKLPDADKAYFQPTIDEMEQTAKEFGLGENGKYALAWIKLWVGSYNAVEDDGPICNNLTDASATDEFGLLVYSKLRSIEESDSKSVNNIKVAAYEDGYEGIGGYGYCYSQGNS